MLTARRVAALFICALLTGAANAYADEKYPRLEYSGGVSYSVIKVIRSSSGSVYEEHDTTYFNGAWLQNIGGSFNLTAHLFPRLLFRMGFSGGIWHYFQTLRAGYIYGGWDNTRRRSSRDISNFHAEYTFGSSARPILQVTGGYFGFGYETDSKSFGGYLLKSDIYPPIIYPGSGGRGYVGFRFNTAYPRFCTQDLVVYEDNRDLSFAYVLTFKPGDVLSAGTGVVLHRMIQADPTKTTSQYLYGIDEKTGDTVHFTYAGTAVMARLSIDPKPLFRLKSFSKDELKVYAEAAILGVKNYPKLHETAVFSSSSDLTVGYENAGERIPVTVGTNLPCRPWFTYGAVPAALSLALIGMEPDSTYPDTIATDPEIVIDTLKDKRGFSHKPYRSVLWAGASVLAGIGTQFLERRLGKMLRLDLLAFEVEWFGSPYRNVSMGEPLPNVPSGSKGREDDWKWAVSARKTFRDNITLEGRIASDHLKMVNEVGWYTADDVLARSNEWYWSLGLSAGF